MISEDEAKELLLTSFDVPRETLATLDRFVQLLKQENARQNLVAHASLEHIWSRHILDSAQLARFAPDARTWLDLGTGAGFPGLIIAAIHPAAVTMIESRRLRVDFLERASRILGLPGRTRIVHRRVEAVETQVFDAIGARAFAPLSKLLDLAQRFAAPQTQWVLPKGRTAQSELEQVQTAWQGSFRVEPSLTDPEAGIIVAEHVSKKVGWKR